MHKAIEKNLWLFGPEYSLFSSTQTLQRMIEDSIGVKYQGDKANNRPDLLLNENLNGEYLLIEFKRPSHALKREDYSQATDYRHELTKLMNKRMRILIIGGTRAPDFPIQNREPGVDVMVFYEVISSARRQLQWQLKSAN